MVDVPLSGGESVTKLPVIRSNEVGGQYSCCSEHQFISRSGSSELMLVGMILVLLTVLALNSFPCLAHALQ